MLLDAQALFSDSQVVTSTAASTNLIDLGTPGTPIRAAQALTPDLGAGIPIPILVQVDIDFAGGTSIAVGLEMDTTAAFGSATVLFLSAAIVTATLVAGYEFLINWIPTGVVEQFLRLNYTVVGSMTGGGAITAGLVSARNQAVIGG